MSHSNVAACVHVCRVDACASMCACLLIEIADAAMMHYMCIFEAAPLCSASMLTYPWCTLQAASNLQWCCAYLTPYLGPEMLTIKAKPLDETHIATHYTKIARDVNHKLVTVRSLK